MSEFDTIVERRGTGSIKWDRCGAKFQTNRDIIPLWIADTDFRSPPEVISAITERAAHGVFGYSFPTQAYLDSIAGWFERRHGLHLKPEWIRPTTGVVTVLYFSVLSLTEPGDQVMTLTPVYDPFYAVVENTGRTLVRSPLIKDGGTYRIDFEDMEAKFRAGVKMLLFCNPHNPTGRVWKKDELAQLVNLCKQYDVYMVSDEIHCDFALFGSRYTSILEYQSIYSKLVMCSAAGKSFNLPGLGTAHMVIPDETLRETVGASLMGAWIRSPNILGMAATKAAYEHGEGWLDEQKAYIEGNSRLVSEFLARKMPEVRLGGHEGTFLMWLDFSCMKMPGDEMCRTLAAQYGVGVGSGKAYSPDYDRYIRLNIGCSRLLLEQALDAIAAFYHDYI